MAVNKFRVVGDSDVSVFEAKLNLETWYDIVDVEISLMGYPMAIMMRRETESVYPDDRYRVISTTEYPKKLEEILNENSGYDVVDGEIFSTTGECSMVVISKDNGSGKGTGGTKNYEELSNLPKINGKLLIGDKDAASLELALNAEGQITWWHATVDPVSKRYFYDTVNNAVKTDVDAYLSTVAAAFNDTSDYRKRDIPYQTKHCVRVVACDLTNNNQLFRMLDSLTYQFLRVYVENVGGVDYIRIANETVATNDYSTLSNKPQINGVTLEGNKTYTALGLEPGWDTKRTEFVAEYGSITLTGSTYAEWQSWISAHQSNGHYSVPYDSTLMVEAWTSSESTDYPLQFWLNGQAYGKNATSIDPLNIKADQTPEAVQTFLVTGKLDSGVFVS